MFVIIMGCGRVGARLANLLEANDHEVLILDNGVAAYVELDCAQQRLRVLVRDVAHGGGAVVLREASLSSGCCRDVAIAGRYVAWSEKKRLWVAFT